MSTPETKPAPAWQVLQNGIDVTGVEAGIRLRRHPHFVSSDRTHPALTAAVEEFEAGDAVTRLQELYGDLTTAEHRVTADEARVAKLEASLSTAALDGGLEAVAKAREQLAAAKTACDNRRADRDALRQAVEQLTKVMDRDFTTLQNKVRAETQQSLVAELKALEAQAVEVLSPILDKLAAARHQLQLIGARTAQKIETIVGSIPSPVVHETSPPAEPVQLLQVENSAARVAI